MDNVNIQLSKDLIAPIIENKVKMAIIEAMGDGKTVITNIVEAVLNLKVDEKGQRQSSDYYNKFTFIDIVLKQTIENACRDAIKEFINENSEKIKEETKRQLCTKKGTGAFVDSFLKGMLKASESDYRFKAEFNFGTLKDY
jgi:hypothetical protein